MNGIVTRHYLRQRFWIATLVLLVTLAFSAVTVVWVLQRQADRANYIIAFHRLGTAATQLEQELALLSVPADEAEADRGRARAAFIGLLTEFRATAVTGVQHQSESGSDTSLTEGHDHLADLDAEFGVDAVAAAIERTLKAGVMCEQLRYIWEGKGAGQGPSGEIGLEVAAARLLRSSAPIVRGEGALTGADRRQLRKIEAVMTEQLAPTLRRVSRMLAPMLNSATRRATLYVVILSGLGIAAALLNLVWIFRPLGRAVMARQAEIISQRDEAMAARIAKRNFLSVVSHELRTPMNGVLGFASLLAASDLKPGQREQVEIIRSSGKTLLALVNDILDFSKLEAGSLELADENFSIEEVISGVVTLLRGGAAAKRLEMSVYFDARLPEQSRGDGNRLRQILINLVGNAIKFTDSGNIGIEAHEVSGRSVPGGGCELQLAVSDTGIGVPPGKTEAIFERFTQIDRNARRKFEGTGLGLAICKQLVDRMGGRIWAESTPGAGSTFFVRIPLAAAAPPMAVSEWRAGAVAALSGRRVLVVDDHSINRRLLRLQLESYGLRVDDAADALGGWALLEKAAAAQDPYAVAILDHMMPDIDGLELARRIRADARFAGLRLLLNSSAGVGDLADARNLGFDAVEEKPVLPRALIGAICGLIGDEPIATAGAADTSPGNAPAKTDDVRILLVGDDRTGQHLVLEMLSRSHYRVDTVADGQEAVRAVAKLPYDLILMDLWMPAIDGVEAVRRIRALGGGASRIPIIALTANAQDEDVAEYATAGMQDVVEKPVDRDVLLAAIDAALDAAEGPGVGPGVAPIFQAAAE